MKFRYKQVLKYFIFNKEKRYNEKYFELSFPNGMEWNKIVFCINM